MFQPSQNYDIMSIFELTVSVAVTVITGSFRTDSSAPVVESVSPSLGRGEVLISKEFSSDWVSMVSSWGFVIDEVIPTVAGKIWKLPPPSIGNCIPPMETPPSLHHHYIIVTSLCQKELPNQLTIIPAPPIH